VDFSIRLWLLDGNKLARNKRELLDAFHFKLEMLGLLRKLDGSCQTGGEQIALSRDARRAALCRNRCFGRGNGAVIAHTRLDAVEIDSRQRTTNKKARQIAALESAL
jgi:hypothetical protein